MRLSWSLVHSRQPEDVNRGIAMLEGHNANTNFPSLLLWLTHCLLSTYGILTTVIIFGPPILVTNIAM